MKKFTYHLISRHGAIYETGESRSIKELFGVLLKTFINHQYKKVIIQWDE